MAGTQPVAVYAMKVPPGDILVPAVPDFAAMFRVSMAAIDPTAEPEYDDVDDKKPPRATLKIVRIPGDIFDNEDELDEEDDSDDEYGSEDEDGDDLLVGLNGVDDDDDEETSDEEENGGPSDPEKAKKAKTSRLVKAITKQEAGEDDKDEDEDEEMSEDDAKAVALLEKIMKRKGKGKASEDEDDDEEEDDDDLDNEDDLEMEEVVVCTLDPENHYQQTLDFVVGEDERIFFKVTGTHTVHLTGNYVIPMDDGHARLYDGAEDEEEDYDLSPDEDELEALEEEDVSSDALDDLDDPRVMEVDTHESEHEPPKLIASATGKGKNKRPAPPSDDEEKDREANLDDIMAKSLKTEGPVAAVKEEPKKLTKAEKKQLKKLKKNDGEAVPVTAVATDPKTTELKKEAAATNGEKKVQFAKNLEQGPTPSATPPAKPDKKTETKANDGKATLGVKEVQGVTIDDRKLGTGPAAKKGDKVEMRYIGKLESGKVFDGKQKPEEATSSNYPTVNPSVNGAGANRSSPKKRTKKGNRSGSNLEPAK